MVIIPAQNLQSVYALFVPKISHDTIDAEYPQYSLLFHIPTGEGPPNGKSDGRDCFDLQFSMP